MSNHWLTIEGVCGILAICAVGICVWTVTVLGIRSSDIGQRQREATRRSRITACTHARNVDACLAAVR